MDTWYEPELDEVREDPAIKEYDITSTPNDFNISTLFNLIDNGVIKMPPFQRNYVWDIKRASKLIESIILGLPVPQVFLYEKGKNNFYVIDGQQRLLSIYFFVKQRFPTKEGRQVLRDFLTGNESINSAVLSDDRYFSNFALSLPSPVITEKNKLDKLKYETLGDYKHTFDYLRTVRSVVIKQNEPDDEDSSIYEIFNRLNTGGQNLTSQEIRMSLFYSEFYQMLLDVNKNQRWRNILGQEAIDLHFKDVEILVRIFAMLYLHKDYQASMTRFLNRFSKAASSFSDESIKYLGELFESFLSSCSELSSKDFYSTNGKFNISLFESVFVATTEPFFKEKELVTGNVTVSSLATLKGNSDFLAATRDSVASRRSVQTRIDLAIDIIELE